MGIEELAGQAPATVFTDDDLVMHTTKMVERTFGRPLEEIGQVVMQDGKAVLSFSYSGQPHTLRWERTARGGINWFIDDSEQGIVLGEPGRAMQRLIKALGG